MRTGPNNPEGSSDESVVKCLQVAKETLPVAGRGSPFTSQSGQRRIFPPSANSASCRERSSPTKRLRQRFATVISRMFPFTLIAPETSTRQGDVQSIPRSRPFRRTPARFFTCPTSSQKPGRLPAALASIAEPLIWGPWCVSITMLRTSPEWSCIPARLRFTAMPAK